MTTSGPPPGRLEPGRLPHEDPRTKVFLVAAPIGNHLDDLSPSSQAAIAAVGHLFVESAESPLLTKLRRAGVVTDAHTLHVLDREAPAKAAALLRAATPFALTANEGLPCFVDPGHHVVRVVRDRFREEAVLVPTGMSSALDAAMAMSGLELKQMLFMGHHPQAVSWDPAVLGAGLPLGWYVSGAHVRGFARRALADVPQIARLLLFRNLRSLSTQRTWVLPSHLDALPDDLQDRPGDGFVALAEIGAVRRFDPPPG